MGGGGRGVCEPTHGGESWRKVLGDGFGNTDKDDQYTGVNEVHMDPRNADVMYAVTWQRLRNVAVVMDGGTGTGLHKSVDGGETWRELSNGLPEEMMGKIGLAPSPQDLDTAKNIESHDPVEQTHKVMQNIRQLLEEAGGDMHHLVKLVVYITDVRYREAVYRTMGEYIKGVHPVCTGLVVQALARPDWLVEIDGTAVIPDE